MRRLLELLAVAFIVAALSPAAAGASDAPRIIGAAMRDRDGNGAAERVVLRYSERIRHRRDADGRYAFRIDGYDIRRIKKTYASRHLVILLQEPAPDAPRSPAIEYRGGSRDPRDRYGNRAEKQLFRNVSPLPQVVDSLDPVLEPSPDPTPSVAPPPAPEGSDGSVPIRFSTLAPGSKLPSGEQCRQWVRRDPWEPRPENYVANHTTGYRINYIDGADEEGQAKLAPRIDGEFTGTTDEIIQWGACKWGLDEDVVRAIAVTESSWRQSVIGDNGQSFGLMQIKCAVHDGTCPWAHESTAFNVDYALAWHRSCYEGYFRYWVPSEARGDEWGCIGLYFSGEWDTNNAPYIETVRRHLSERPWRQPGF